MHPTTENTAVNGRGEPRPLIPGLAGKTAVVTGAGSGIGLAVVGQLVASDVTVLGVDLDIDQIADIAGTIGVTQDLRDSECGDRIAHAARDVLGRVDILVNAVGEQPVHDGGFLSIDDPTWLATHQVNFLSTVRMCRSIIPIMQEVGAGSIVNVGSIAAREPAILSPDYAAAKAGLLSLTKTISVEFGHERIRCNLVAPGPTLTPVFQTWVESLATRNGVSFDEELSRFITSRRRMALPHAGEPSDVAYAVAFLSSDMARQITGSEVRVDGGALQSIL